jgi:hypothetical protein
VVAISMSTPRAGPRAAMVSPTIDALCIGGLSIAVCAALLAFGPVPLDKHLPPLVPYVLTAVITWPHFLASYRLLYATRDSIQTYRTASLYFPVALAGYGLFAIARSPATALHVNLLALLAGTYLARHYAGQTWGMIASFSHLAKVPPSAIERGVMQWSLRLIMAWHIVWASARGVAGVAPSLTPLALRLDAHVDPIAGVSFALGLAMFGMMAKRTGAPPPLRVVLPWLALYGWYALLRRDPGSMFVVQLAHALQYLVFPLRIEETRRDRSARPITARRVVAWIVPLILLSVAAFAGIPTLFRLCYLGTGGAGDLSDAFTSVFVSFVNIHHYFIDGCLYRLRNPAVRRDLFAHIQPAADARA